MKRFIRITVFVSALLVGIVSSLFSGIINFKQANEPHIQAKTALNVILPRFRLLRSDFNSYQFQSSDREKRFMYDCEECGEEIGDISVLHNFPGAEGLREIFQANCAKKPNRTVERSFSSNNKGQRNREKCVITERSGKTRIIWNESETEYWTIDAASLKLAEEFENSQTFNWVKRKEYSKNH